MATKLNWHWIPKGGGIYQRSDTKGFYHRPTINGKRVFRVLSASTLANARDAKTKWDNQALNAKGGLCPHPDAPKGFETVGEVLRYWEEKSCPGRGGRPRTDWALYRAKQSVAILLPFWDKVPVSGLRFKALLDYKAYRLRHSKKMKSANTLEKERFPLLFAFRHAHRDERIIANPMATFPQESLSNATRDTVRHCRNCRPNDGDELHQIARLLFESDARSHVIGFQMLIEAYTGCRTSEVLRFRWDAKPNEPGFIDGDILHIQRLKRGVNPWVKITPHLRAAIEALRSYRERRGSESPWWFPSCEGNGKAPVSPGTLTERLEALRKRGLIPRKVTSHGMRAFYVTARRSEFAPDALIAAEIGDKMGAQIICDVYGDLPPNWLTTNTGKIEWMPKAAPAWSYFDEQPAYFWTRLAKGAEWGRNCKLRAAAKAQWAEHKAAVNGANVVRLIQPGAAAEPVPGAEASTAATA